MPKNLIILEKEFMRLFFAIFLIIFATSIFSEENNTEVYISLVPKNRVRKLLAFKEYQKYDIVATKEIVANALKTFTLKVEQDEELFFAERSHQHDAPFPLKKHQVKFENDMYVVTLNKDKVTGCHSPLFSGWALKKIRIDREIKLASQRERKTNLQILLSGLIQRYNFIDIDKEFIQVKLEELTGVRPVVVNGKTIFLNRRYEEKDQELSREYLVQEYKKLGYSATVGQHSSKGLGDNVVAEKIGSDPSKVFIISSHADTVRSALGADDNGSGTIGCLAIAKAFKDYNFKYTIRFLNFDEEESGMVGSRAYVDFLEKKGGLQEIICALNMDMIGYDGDKDRVFNVANCNDFSKPLNELVISTLEENSDKLNLRARKLCAYRSDHVPFWNAGIPALLIIENFFGGEPNPFYHSSRDTVAAIDYDYMRDIAALVANSAVKVLVIE